MTLRVNDGHVPGDEKKGEAERERHAASMSGFAEAFDWMKANFLTRNKQEQSGKPAESSAQVERSHKASVESAKPLEKSGKEPKESIFTTETLKALAEIGNEVAKAGVQMLDNVGYKDHSLRATIKRVLTDVMREGVAAANFMKEMAGNTISGIHQSLGGAHPEKSKSTNRGDLATHISQTDTSDVGPEAIVRKLVLERNDLGAPTILSNPMKAAIFANDSNFAGTFPAPTEADVAAHKQKYGLNDLLAYRGNSNAEKVVTYMTNATTGGEEPGTTKEQAEAAQRTIEARADYKPFAIVFEDGTAMTASGVKEPGSSDGLIAQAPHTGKSDSHAKIYHSDRSREAGKHHKPEKIPPLMLRHDVSDAFFNQMWMYMDSIPKEHKEQLAKGGYHIEVVKDVATYDREHHTNYATQKPEGYTESDYTAENLGAFFDANNKTVVICEYYTPYHWSVQTKTSNVLDMAARMRHETGHAYDQLRKFELEKDPAVHKMYEKARDRLNDSPITAKALAYYFQDNVTDDTSKITARPGLREAIGELYAIKHGGGAAKDSSIDKSLEELFKDLLEYMSKKGY